MVPAVPHGGSVGKSVSVNIKEFLEDPEFKAEYERLAPCEELARIVIMRRAALGLTQAELAARMGTTASAISRIESGQHATSSQTVKKLADAFGARAGSHRQGQVVEVAALVAGQLLGWNSTAG